jgi:hypothetical protein
VASKEAGSGNLLQQVLHVNAFASAMIQAYPCMILGGDGNHAIY